MGVGLVLIVLLYLARPFAVDEDEDARINREEIDGLLLRKESILRDIRELDDDYEAAKVAPELYAARRPQMMKQAAIIMKQLDDHGYVEAAGVPANLDTQIEAAVRRIRTPERLDEQMEAAIRQARQSTAKAATAAPAANGATRFCPQCGHRVEPGDRFCPKCGHNHTEEAGTAQAARA